MYDTDRLTHAYRTSRRHARSDRDPGTPWLGASLVSAVIAGVLCFLAATGIGPVGRFLGHHWMVDVEQFVGLYVLASLSTVATVALAISVAERRR